MYNEEEKRAEYPKRQEYPDMPDRAESQLPLSSQERAITELHDTIRQLISRLQPVLTPSDSNKTVTDTGIEPQPVQSPLAQQLFANNNGIFEASTKLRAIMDRLEC